MAFISASILFSACGTPQKYNSKVTAQEKTETTDREISIEEENSEIEKEKIFFTEISAEKEYVLVENGIGIDFNLNFSPINATEDIIIDIKDKEIVNFGSELSSEEQSSLLNFTIEGNFVYPLAVGETEIVITAPKNETEDLKIICKMVVLENEEDLSIQISDINGNTINQLKSAPKANGEREIYKARVSSFKPLQNELNILNSEGVIIEENSIVYFQEADKFLCDFNFYLETENNYLQVSRKENYSNSDTTISSKKIIINSKNYVNGLDVRISRLDGGSPIIFNDNYIMYITDKDLMQAADQNGYFNNYIINLFDLSGNKFKDFEINLEPNSIVNFSDIDEVNTIFASGLGDAELTITALDGSGYSSKINFTVKTIEPTSLKIAGVEILSNFEESDLENEIGKDVSIYAVNDLGKTDEFSLSFLIDNIFVSDSYISFNSDPAVSISINVSQNEEGVLKEFVFKSEAAGEYNIDIIIDGIKIYSFTINVLNLENHMEFSTRDTDENIEYSLDEEDKTITILDSDNFKGELIFKCLTFDVNNLEQSENLIVEYDETICSIQIQSLKQIYISGFEKMENFTLKITETISGICEEITIIFN